MSGNAGWNVAPGFVAGTTTVVRSRKITPGSEALFNRISRPTIDLALLQSLPAGAR
jgi:hypothetical protein